MSKKTRLVILGAGGHARSLIDVVRTHKVIEIVGILDPDRNKHGTSLDGVSVIGGDEQLESLKAQFDLFIVGVGSSGTDNRARTEVYQRCMRMGLEPYSAVSTLSIVSTSTTVGQGCQIFHSAIINAGCRLGEHVIINTAAVIEHDCIIGDHAHIATAATLAGGVRIGTGAFIGCGAVVIPGIQIGENAVVGAGATVIKDVPSGSRVAGNPARQLR
jgi:sugar O-acyltransferase (sialic acid O-acetyltransferase NeuD family)